MVDYVFILGLHFRSKKNGTILIVFEDLSRSSVFFRTEVKYYLLYMMI